MSNLDPTRARQVSIELRGTNATRVGGRVLTAPAITSYNTFEQPDVVRPARNGNVVRYTLAADLNAEILEDIGRAFDKLEARSA